eukprot:s3008_g11.t1
MHGSLDLQRSSFTHWITDIAMESRGPGGRRTGANCIEVNWQPPASQAPQGVTPKSAPPRKPSPSPIGPGGRGRPTPAWQKAEGLGAMALPAPGPSTSSGGRMGPVGGDDPQRAWSLYSSRPAQSQAIWCPERPRVHVPCASNLYFSGDMIGSSANTTLGPFCGEVEGKFRCKSKEWLCGCRSSSCEGGLQRSELLKLDFEDAVVRMATFKKVMKVPSCICTAGGWLDNSWVLWLLGGAVEWKELDGECKPCTEAPSHAWSEIELPRSQCYLMLGAGTSTFRDRGPSAFRLLLHDTTFRFWPREEGKLIYGGLLLHEPLRLGPRHVELLQRLIRHGEIRDALASAAENFERSLDQDFDLNPLFLELVPGEFTFQDQALVSMVAAYFGLFRMYWRLGSFSPPWVNCVVTALLFGLHPEQLLELVPVQVHQETRHQALEMNRLWQERILPVMDEARNVFQSTVEVPRLASTWWRWWPPPREVQRLDQVQQIQRFRWAFVQKGLEPLRSHLASVDQDLALAWDQQLPWTRQIRDCQDLFQESLFQHGRSHHAWGLQLSGDLENCVERFLSTARGSDVCRAPLEVERNLFCPESQHRVSVEDLMSSTERLLRKLLYWQSVSKIRKARDGFESNQSIHLLYACE